MVEDKEIEHRLTAIETTMSLGFMQTTTAINGVGDKVKIQNNRIGKLEEFRGQLVAIVAVAMATSPFVFFVLSRVFPMNGG